jgi:hypothetical protein
MYFGSGLIVDPDSPAAMKKPGLTGQMHCLSI